MGFLVEENDWKTARVSYRGGNLGFLGLSASLLISYLIRNAVPVTTLISERGRTMSQLEAMMACVFKLQVQAPSFKLQVMLDTSRFCWNSKL
jgi:hypothetical protein